jgi:GAF domain-containing protein
MELFAVQHVGIALISPDRTTLTIVADRSDNPEDESALGLQIPLAGNALSSQVIETRRPVIVENAKTNPLTEPVHDIMRWRGTEVLVLLPLTSGRETIGTVGLDIVEQDRVFSEAELQLAATIVAQIATAVQNVRLFEQTEARAQELAVLNDKNERLFEQAQARSEELSILNEMGRSLTALVDMDSILENVYRYTARLMDATNFYIGFYDMKRDEISFALDIRGDRVMRNAGTRKAGKGLTEHIINTKEPLLISENVDGKLDELGIEKIGPAAASWLGVPMMVGSQVIGIIGIQNWETPRTYNEQHLRLLTSVSGQAAIAIENARLFEQIQARARRERILREVTAKVRGATDADSVMRTAVQEIGRALGRRTFVYLNQNQQYETELTQEEAYGD